MQNGSAVQPLQVTAKAAAAMMGYSIRYFNELVYTGQIRVAGKGKARRVPISEIERWQRENMAQ